MEEPPDLTRNWKLFPLSIFQLRFIPVVWVYGKFCYGVADLIAPELSLMATVQRSLLYLVFLGCFEVVLRRWPRPFAVRFSGVKAWSGEALGASIVLATAILLFTSSPRGHELGSALLGVSVIGLFLWLMFSILDSYEKSKKGRNGANALLFVSVASILTFTAIYVFQAYS